MKQKELEKRDRHVGFTTSITTWKKIQAAAQAAGQSVSRWIDRTLAQAVAK